PDQKSISRAAEVINAGGLVAYPTETYYALGADALCPSAVEKVYRAKGRDFHKALTILVDRRESLHTLVAQIDPAAEKLMERFWPGPLTIIFAASEKVPALLTAGTGRVGIRVPSSIVARALASTAGRPLTATSANPSGRGGLTRAEDVSAVLGEKIDLILDGGETPGGPESTIVDATVSPPALVRAGAVSRVMVEECLGLRFPTPGRRTHDS
ncbi:MAG: L-threonylcarbamoyladenylate synthase, partial [Candidatus Bipolaricaulia bacterium]